MHGVYQHAHMLWRRVLRDAMPEVEDVAIAFVNICRAINIPARAVMLLAHGNETLGAALRSPGGVVTVSAPEKIRTCPFSVSGDGAFFNDLINDDRFPLAYAGCQAGRTDVLLKGH